MYYGKEVYKSSVNANMNILKTVDYIKEQAHMVPNIHICVIGKESPWGVKVSHHSSSSEMRQQYHTEEILSCLCIV